jgi:type I restriction enzyme S subunit
MKLETFFEKFDQFADAPDAVAAMRELVLQLAVRGNLTERIGGESSTAQLAVADAFRVRRAKREKPDAEDVPFPIPENWGWVAVGDSMDMFNGRAFKPEEWSTEGTPIIRIQNLNNEHAAFNRCKADLDPKIHVHDGDFLISWSGTPGTSFGAFIWNRGFAYLNQHIFRCELVQGVFEKAFLRLAINARLDEMISHAQGAVGLRHITKGKLESIRLPLPPLAEQKRIVAKVNELMALCDRLEAQQLARETRHAALARASLARFADAPTPANLPFLFHSSFTISPTDLRKSIFTLAVQGKLVPFDTDGEEQTVGDHIEFQNGYAFKSEWFKPSGMRLCRNLNVSHGNLDWRESAFVDDKVAKEFERFALGEGDIVLSLDRPLIATGLKVARVMQADLPCLLLQRVAKPMPKHDRLDLSYFMLWLNSAEFVDSIDPGRSNGVPHISTRQVQRLPFVLPPLAEQRRIVAKVEQLMALVDALETQLAASRATAANLLSALVAELTSSRHESHPWRAGHSTAT